MKAKRLKELGEKQESLFWWTNESKLLFDKDYWELTNHFGLYPKMEYISAFTVAELGEMLPIKMEGEYLDCYKIDKPDGQWECGYGSALNGYYEEDKNEANSRAKMRIYLLENNLIKL